MNKKDNQKKRRVNGKMNKILILLIGLVLISFISAEQVLWDDDSDIEVYDAWKDVDGTPLTGADCSWYVYDSDGTVNQEGEAVEFSVGIFNFSVSSLAIGIYPLRINCSLGGYNGTSTKDSIKIIDELSEEYKKRLEEINQTTYEINQTVSHINKTVTEINKTTHEINITIHEVYDYLLGDITANLTYISNLTFLTYNNTLSLETSITNLDTKLTTLQTYVQNKWGNEDADKIIDKIKDIRSDVTYLRSRYYAITEAEKRSLLLSIRQDSQEVLSLLYGKDKWWENLLIWLIPLGILILIIVIICLIARKVKKKKPEEFGGDLHER